MKTKNHKLLHTTALLLAALTFMLALGACASRDRDRDRETEPHTHAPGTPPHSH